MWHQVGAETSSRYAYPATLPGVRAKPGTHQQLGNADFPDRVPGDTAHVELALPHSADRHAEHPARASIPMKKWNRIKKYFFLSDFKNFNKMKRLFSHFPCCRVGRNDATRHFDIRRYNSEKNTELNIMALKPSVLPRLVILLLPWVSLYQMSRCR